MTGGPNATTPSNVNLSGRNNINPLASRAIASLNESTFGLRAAATDAINSVSRKLSFSGSKPFLRGIPLALTGPVVPSSSTLAPNTGSSPSASPPTRFGATEFPIGQSSSRSPSISESKIEEISSIEPVQLERRPISLVSNTGVLPQFVSSNGISIGDYSETDAWAIDESLNDDESDPSSCDSMPALRIASNHSSPISASSARRRFDKMLQNEKDVNLVFPETPKFGEDIADLNGNLYTFNEYGDLIEVENGYLCDENYISQLAAEIRRKRNLSRTKTENIPVRHRENPSGPNVVQVKNETLPQALHFSHNASKLVPLSVTTQLPLSSLPFATVISGPVPPPPSGGSPSSSGSSSSSQSKKKKSKKKNSKKKKVPSASSSSSSSTSSSTSTSPTAASNIPTRSIGRQMIPAWQLPMSNHLKIQLTKVFVPLQSNTSNNLKLNLSNTNSKAKFQAFIKQFSIFCSTIRLFTINDISKFSVDRSFVNTMHSDYRENLYILLSCLLGPECSHYLLNVDNNGALVWFNILRDFDNRNQVAFRLFNNIKELLDIKLTNVSLANLVSKSNAILSQSVKIVNEIESITGSPFDPKIKAVLMLSSFASTENALVNEKIIESLLTSYQLNVEAITPLVISEQVALAVSNASSFNSEAKDKNHHKHQQQQTANSASTKDNTICCYRCGKAHKVTACTISKDCECKYCHKSGHLEVVCNKKKRKENAKSEDGTSSSNVSHHKKSNKKNESAQFASIDLSQNALAVEEPYVSAYAATVTPFPDSSPSVDCFTRAVVSTSIPSTHLAFNCFNTIAYDSYKFFNKSCLDISVVYHEQGRDLIVVLPPGEFVELPSHSSSFLYNLSPDNEILPTWNTFCKIYSFNPDNSFIGHIDVRWLPKLQSNLFNLYYNRLKREVVFHTTFSVALALHLEQQMSTLSSHESPTSVSVEENELPTLQTPIVRDGTVFSMDHQPTDIVLDPLTSATWISEWINYASSAAIQPFQLNTSQICFIADILISHWTYPSSSLLHKLKECLQLFKVQVIHRDIIDPLVLKLSSIILHAEINIANATNLLIGTEDILLDTKIWQANGRLHESISSLHPINNDSVGDISFSEPTTCDKVPSGSYFVDNSFTTSYPGADEPYDVEYFNFDWTTPSNVASTAASLSLTTVNNFHYLLHSYPDQSQLQSLPSIPDYEVILSPSLINFVQANVASLNSKTSQYNNVFVEAILDSGATCHLGGHPLFDIIFNKSCNLKVQSAFNNSFAASKMGDVVMHTELGLNLPLNNKIYVPGMSKTLLSVAQLAKDGFDVSFKGRSAVIAGKGRTPIIINEKNGTYSIHLYFPRKYRDQSFQDQIAANVSHDSNDENGDSSRAVTLVNRKFSIGNDIAILCSYFKVPSGSNSSHPSGYYFGKITKENTRRNAAMYPSNGKAGEFRYYVKMSNGSTFTIREPDILSKSLVTQTHNLRSSTTKNIGSQSSLPSSVKATVPPSTGTESSVLSNKAGVPSLPSPTAPSVSSTTSNDRIPSSGNLQSSSVTSTGSSSPTVPLKESVTPSSKPNVAPLAPPTASGRLTGKKEKKSKKKKEKNSRPNDGTDFVPSPAPPSPSMQPKIKISPMPNDMALHLRYGHANADALAKLSLVDPKIVLKGDWKFDSCVHCIAAKGTHHYAGKGFTHKPLYPLETVCLDGLGPVTPKSINFNEYGYLAADPFSSFLVEGFTRNKKGHSAANLIYFVKSLQSNVSRKIRHFHCDSASDFKAIEFVDYCRMNDIKITYSTPYHHMENGVVERPMRTIWNSCRAMMFTAAAPEQLWDYAFSYSVYVKNRTPCRHIEWRTPFELVHSYCPELSRLRVWGCLVWFFNPKQTLSKLEPRMKPGVFLGIDERNASHCYTIGHYYESGRAGLNIIQSTDVTFSEGKFFFNEYPPSSTSLHINEPDFAVSDIAATSGLGGNSTATAMGGHAIQGKKDKSVSFSETINAIDESGTVSSAPLSNISNDMDDDISTTPVHALLSTTVEESKATRTFHTYARATNTIGSTDSNVKYTNPKSYKDAMSRSSPEAAAWDQATDDEWIGNILKRAITIVDASEARGKEILPTFLIFTLKPATNGNPERHKVRCVTNGAKEDVSLIGSLYAPTASSTIVRLMMTIYTSAEFQSSGKNIVIRAGDVSNAFTNADLPKDREIFIRPPLSKYYIPGKAFKLKTALYGLKESPRLWYDKMKVILFGIGFQVSEHEQCLFFKFKNGKLSEVIVLFVDDLLWTGPLAGWQRIVKHINKHVSFKDLGQPDTFLGMEIEITEAGIYLSQERYIGKIIKRFGFDSLNPTKTPMDTNVKLEKLDTHTPNPTYFQEMAGSLQYAATNTRYDISYPLMKASSHLLAHNETHFSFIKRIFRYLKGTKDLALFSPMFHNFELKAYSDANWDAPSTSSVLITCAGMPIAHASNNQKSISLSTMEAELYAASQACRIAHYISDVLKELHIIPDVHPINLYIDSQSAIDLVNNASAVVPARHMKIRAHYLRHQVATNKIRMLKIHSVDNLSDIGTKALAIDRHHMIVSRLLHPRPSTSGSDWGVLANDFERMSNSGHMTLVGSSTSSYSSSTLTSQNLNR